MFHLPLIELLVALILYVLGIAGLPGLFALMAVESFGIPPLPSEVILLFAGFLVVDGSYSFGAAFVAAWIGGVAGAYVAYWVGRDARSWLFPLDRPSRLPIERAHLDRMDAWFSKHGEGTVAFARIVPLVRSYVSYPAGAARMNPLKFGAFTAVGSAPWVAVLIYAGVRLGSAWSSILPYFDLLDDVAIVGLVAIALVLFLRWRGLWPGGRVTRSSGPPPPAAGTPP